ncbi:MAG TPA: S8 family serine peptidase [Sedimentisphaerales bacterium]|nr:S8 family serine peptidase [Sedimentisphaerales bacterium]
MGEKILLNFAVLLAIAGSTQAANAPVARECAPNQILIKFRETTANAVAEQLGLSRSAGELTLSQRLDELNTRYRLKRVEPLFKDFKKNLRQMEALLQKDEKLLAEKQKLTLRRLRRAPKDAKIPNLERIYKIKLDLSPGQSLEEAVAAYNNTSGVEFAELNYIVSINLTPNDPLYSLQWPLNNTGQMYPESGNYNHPPGAADCDIDGPEAWDSNTGSPTAVVAVVDTGIDYAHRDLQANMWVNEAEFNGTVGVDDDGNGYVDDIYGYDFFTRDGDPKDDHGHGTHCAGIIAAKGNNGLDITGVCWNARIMALKFLDWTGQGSTSDAVSAFYYAVENGADVTSNSWGGGDYSETMKEAIDYAHSQGVIMVASAGNDYSDTPVYPAGYGNMFSVAATDSNDQKAPFSNYGRWVDIAAPGVDILSLRAYGTLMGTVYDAYTTIASGTSMACPHVAGACALLLSANPTLINVDVYDILMETVNPIQAGICRSDGRLNLSNAVLAAVPPKGRIHLDHRYYSCSGTISVSLGDCDLAGGGTQAITVTTNGGDSETVVLTETTPPVGFFTGTAPIDSGVPSPDDGTVQLAHSQIITATYYDANDGTGNPAVAEDSAIGDCEGPVILGVHIDPFGPEPEVSFETDEASTASVKWGLACGAGANLIVTDSDLRTSHTMKLTGVSQDTEYFFKIEADDALGNSTVDDNDGACYSFATDNGPGDVYVPTQVSTIQKAIDRSWDGGRVWVADGTYRGEGNRDIDFNGKAITVSSLNGPANCIIDCEGLEASLPHRGFHFHTGEGADSVLDGFTVINGYEYWFPPDDCGGAIRCEAGSPTIKNCIFRANVSGGGAMGNRAGSNPTVINCTFSDNYGRGMSNEGSSPTVVGCTFSKNLATDIYSGAGMDNRDGSNPMVINCTFSGNKIGTYGGGMANISSSPTVVNCQFTGNHAGRDYYPEDQGYGGGMSNQNSSPNVINCTFGGNTADDDGGGIASKGTSHPAITNCILWGNSDSDGEDESAQVYGGTPAVNYSCIQGLSGVLGGTGNIGADPCFTRPGHWNDNGTPDNNRDDFWVNGLYYLSPGKSPCIDSGDNQAVLSLVAADLEGSPRFLDDPNVPDTGNGPAPVVDMGAYEYWPAPELYVDDNALNDPGPGDPHISDQLENGSQAHPFDRIQEAIYAARYGKIVVVAAGTYYETINFIGKDITVTSLDPNDPGVVGAAIIDANGAGSAVTFASGEGPEAVLTGLTVTGGTGTEGWNGCWGGGLYCDHASPVIRANIITGNHCPMADSGVDGLGGGIACLNSRAIIERNIIKQNEACSGGGINVYHETAGSVYYGHAVIVNNLIYDNLASRGGGVEMYNGLLINNTIVGNSAAREGGNVIVFGNTEPEGSQLVVINNIISGALNQGGLAWAADSNTGWDCIAYNNVWGNAGADYCGLPDQAGINGNISEDPLFVDAAAHDYRLRCNSPCVEAGTNDPCGIIPATDFDGQPRPFDANNDGAAITDIGAYESRGNRPLILLTPTELEFSYIEGDPSPQPAVLFIRNATCGILNWTIAEACTWLEAEPNNGSASVGELDSVTLTVNTSGLAVGHYNCELSVLDPNAENSPQTVRVTLSVSALLRVPTAKYPTIQAAIDAASDAAVVIVADGTYTGPGNRDIDLKGKAITVRSENGPANCIIDCQGTETQQHRGFYCRSRESALSVVEGFTITGGHTYFGGGMANYSACPKVAHCIFAGNTAYAGGGMENVDASPTIINCTFSGNYASFGGGIDNYGTSSPNVTNCILWGDNASEEAEICGDGLVSYSDVQGGFAGEGNIDADPRFADAANSDYHLLPGSPAVDAGDPNSEWSSEPWPNGGRVNMGAYGNTRQATRSRADYQDLAKLAEHWLEYEPSVDIAPAPDGDGMVNLLDFAVLANCWLR